MGFKDWLIEKRGKNMRLPSIVKYYQSQYNPLLDEQVCLAHVINLMVEADLKITKREIYYCFKKNYNRELHGDVQSYVTWLYSFAHPSNKKANNSISEANNAQRLKKINETSPSSGEVAEGLK